MKLGRHYSWLKKITIHIILSLLLVVGMINIPTVTASADEGGVRRMINVVYDDSGSMVVNGTKRWSQAKYAMEVFCALMGEEDIMNIYPMSIPGELGLMVNGRDNKRVKSVHDMNAHYRNTPFTTVTKAADDLLSTDSKYEKWLVIITDGEFDDGATPIDTVQSAVDSYNKKGIHTIYLAIGDKAKTLNSNPSLGGYADKAEDGVDVLYKVTSMANQIFQHLILSDKYIDRQGNNSTLHFDIPIDTLIVFAQGDNVEIGSMTQGNNVISPSDVQNVKYSDVIPENYPDAVTDTSLKGVVATYKSAGKPYAAGVFSIEVSNANTVEYYYAPGVELNCSLMYRNQPISGQDKLYAGEYDIRMNFIDPLSGKELDSDLLKVDEFKLSLINNEQETLLNSGQEHVHINEGDVSLRAQAVLPGNVVLSSTKNYTVYPEPIELNISVEGNAPSYSPDQMGDNARPIILVIKDSAGNELSADQKIATKIEIESKNQINWNVKYNESIGRWEARPIYVGDSIKDMATGDDQYSVSASFEVGKLTAFGSSTITMTVNSYEGSALEVHIGDPTAAYEMKTLEDAPGMPVTVSFLDPTTNEPLEISEELWDAISVKAEGEGVSWTIEKTETPGLAVLKPRYRYCRLRTQSGDVQVKVHAEGTLGEYYYTGKDTKTVNIAPLSREDKIRDIIELILRIGFILWLVVGYLKKKRLRLRGLNPRCHYLRKESSKRRIKKNIWTVILPYLSERAVVKCRSSGYQCNFPDLKIIATGSRSFRILNKSIDLKNTLINGDRFDDMKSLRKRSFGMGSFDITSLDRKTGKRLGSFTFN